MPQELEVLMVTLSAIAGGLFAAGLIIAVGVFLLFSVIFLFFYSFTLMFGAKIVDIKNRTFGKALTATFLYVFIASIPCTILFFIAWPLGIVAFLVTPCFVVKWIYECSLSQAFLASISSLVVSFVLIIASIVGTVYYIKGSIGQKKINDIEKSSKVEAVEAAVTPKASENKVTFKATKIKVEEPLPIKEAPKKTLPEKAISKPPASAKTTKTIKPKISNAKVIVKSKPKAKPIDKKHAISLAKK